MKRIVFLVLGMLGTAAASTVFAQSDAEMIERALAGAPRRVRTGATVVKWNPDHTHVTIKEGTNQMVCYDRSGEPGRQPFAVQCTSLANLDRVAQNRRFAAEASNPEELQARLDAAEADGSRVTPEYGSVFISMNGPDAASARSHTTIAVPGATTASIGLPESPGQGGAWLMNAGTSTAHIMTPGH